MKRSGAPARHRSDHAGFSLTEILIVVAIIALLVAVSLPMYLNFLRRAEASSIVSDYHTFVNATMQYHADLSQYPPDRLPGEQVPELVPYIGDRMKMTHSRWLYDWENWINADGTPMHASTGIAYGFTVQTADLRLADALFFEYPGLLYQTQPNRYTFMIEPLEEH
jgi:prepilin-type N-terminal cleavage/methylation domain-containing protein